MDEVRKIVFICTGNTCRSPMAEALFNHLNHVPGWIASSCGLAAFGGEPVSDNALKTLHDDYGIDFHNHRSRPVSPDCIDTAQLILTMTMAQKEHLRHVFPEAAERIMTLGECAGQPETSVSDPFGRDLAAYRQTAAAIADLVRKIIEILPKISAADERQNDNHSV